MMNAIDALGALADPTRRSIFALLSKRALSVTQVTAGLSVTQSAVSQHLRVLRESGLVKGTPVGTKRIYAVDPWAIAQIREWLDLHWATALASFADFANQQSDNEEGL